MNDLVAHGIPLANIDVNPVGTITAFAGSNPPSMNSSGSHSHTAAGNTNGSTATNIATTASNNAATATNQNTTAKNRDTTATNIAATATNIATTAVNQDTGSSIAMDITNPYQVINFIIKVK